MECAECCIIRRKFHKKKQNSTFIDHIIHIAILVVIELYTLVVNTTS